MTHELKMDVKRLDLSRTGVEFTVHDDNGKSGTLEVRIGTLTWYSGRKTKNNKSVVSWEEFDKFMADHRVK